MPNKKSSRKNTNESLTLSTLAERVNKKIGSKNVDENNIKQVTNAFFDVIKREILDTGSFKLLGFGTFERMRIEESTRKNPRTGEEVITPEHYKIKFVPASGLAKRINKPYESLKPEIIEEAAEDEAQEDITRAEHESALPDEAWHEDTSDAKNYAPMLEEASIVKSTASELDAVFDDDLNISFPDEEVQSIQSPQLVEDTFATEVQPISRDEQTVANQTVQHAIIEHQVIQQQVVQQQVIQQQRVQNEFDDDAYDPDYDNDDYDEDIQKYISRCWFFAGVAVVLTAFMISVLIYVLVHREPKQQTEVPRTTQEIVLDESVAPYAFRIATDDNLYATLAAQQYGERNLWPYIFSANMLRFSDPDNPGGASQLTVPVKPDKTIDRRDIELAVIDVYDSYRALIAQHPNGRTAAARKEHAVIALLCGESLYSGFIDKYAVRLDAEDVKAAREAIAHARIYY
ncbi:MAG: HU family DNA-binding protein [Treponema sp.]|nr:HU family DNA-binding protein [Treponema sp.]